MERRRLSLRTRLSFVLTGLLAGLLLGLAGLWLQGARTGIHEEVEAATRVSEQWLQVIARQSAASGISADHLLALLQPAGRIRANALEVLDAAGQRLYLSPPPSYKQGRVVPTYFAHLVEPEFAARRIEFGALAVVIHPDPSRSIIDAWDDFCAMAGLALAFLAVLFIASRLALDRALKPLEKLLAALDRTGQGRFDIRLPAPAAPELARLARAYNGMADRLAQAVDENVLKAIRKLPAACNHASKPSGAASPVSCMTNWHRASRRYGHWPGQLFSAVPISLRCRHQPTALLASPVKCRTAYAIF